MWKHQLKENEEKCLEYEEKSRHIQQENEKLLKAVILAESETKAVD